MSDKEDVPRDQRINMGNLMLFKVKNYRVKGKCVKLEFHQGSEQVIMDGVEIIRTLNQ